MSQQPTASSTRPATTTHGQKNIYKVTVIASVEHTGHNKASKQSRSDQAPSLAMREETMERTDCAPAQRENHQGDAEGTTMAADRVAKKMTGKCRVRFRYGRCWRKQGRHVDFMRAHTFFFIIINFFIFFLFLFFFIYIYILLYFFFIYYFILL
jgi:hypothetical protein